MVVADTRVASMMYCGNKCGKEGSRRSATVITKRRLGATGVARVARLSQGCDYVRTVFHTPLHWSTMWRKHSSNPRGEDTATC